MYNEGQMSFCYFHNVKQIQYSNAKLHAKAYYEVIIQEFATIAFWSGSFPAECLRQTTCTMKRLFASSNVNNFLALVHACP